MHNKDFKFKDGVLVQQEQLERWKNKLVPQLFDDLKEEAMRRNEIVKEKDNGYLVFRGSDMDCFIANWS